MKKVWENWLKEAVFIYCVVYTFVTILNSVLYLADGLYEDPSGNWHELTRAGIVLIGIIAFEMAKHLKMKNVFLKALVIYVPTMLLAFAFVWSTQFIEPLAKSAYRDIFINYTSLFVIVSMIAIVTAKVKAKKD